MIMLSLQKIAPNSQKRRQNITNTNLNDNSDRELDNQRREMTSNDLNRPQMTSNDLAKPETNTESTGRHASNKRNKKI